MSRIDSSAYQWFAVLVPPQRERAVETILGNAGFAVFVPTRTEWNYANKFTRGRGKLTEHTYVVIPRLVFIGMNKSTPGWHGALRFRIVTSIIGQGGVPSEIPHDTIKGRPGLRDLMWKFNAGRFNAPSHQQYMLNRRFEVGDVVVTEDELFTGRVMEFNGNMAKVLLDILGGERTVKIFIEHLRGAG